MLKQTADGDSFVFIIISSFNERIRNRTLQVSIRTEIIITPLCSSA